MASWGLFKSYFRLLSLNFLFFLRLDWERFQEHAVLILKLGKVQLLFDLVDRFEPMFFLQLHQQLETSRLTAVPDKPVSS